MNTTASFAPPMPFASCGHHAHTCHASSQKQCVGVVYAQKQITSALRMNTWTRQEAHTANARRQIPWRGPMDHPAPQGTDVRISRHNGTGKCLASRGGHPTMACAPRSEIALCIRGNRTTMVGVRGNRTTMVGVSAIIAYVRVHIPSRTSKYCHRMSRRLSLIWLVLCA